jgi:3-amino-4-hydroxybenzoic acid synthase
MKYSWLDMRTPHPAATAILEEAVHQKLHGVVVNDPKDVKDLPPTVKRIVTARDGKMPKNLVGADIVVVDDKTFPSTVELKQAYPELSFGRYVNIVDPATLEDACRAARLEEWAVLEFKDPTKIPLEIVIAAAAAGKGAIITVASDVEEAQIIAGVLEHGSGVLLAPKTVGDATAVQAALNSGVGEIKLAELKVTGITHVGMGERACVDTCTYFKEDEGILVGSHSKGMILCVSETHPLPYMPTRPFRVNAGAIMSYTVATSSRTSYLSELVAGSKVLAVDVKGQTREVTVGRVKIETRPLLSVDAVSADGTKVNLILQDDWHVRVLGPNGIVLNSTELKPGDTVLGYLPTEDRHVGYPINEFCREQ